MQSNPVDLALRAVTQTRHLLERLILSSERFDYPAAKTALAELDRKMRDLARLQARLEASDGTPPANVRKINFRKRTETKG